MLDWASYALPSCWSGKLGRRSYCFNTLEEKHLYYRVIHSAVGRCLSKTKATLWSSWCCDRGSCFATAVVSHCGQSECRGTSPLPFSSKPSSIVEGYWVSHIIWECSKLVISAFKSVVYVVDFTHWESCLRWGVKQNQHHPYLCNFEVVLSAYTHLHHYESLFKRIFCYCFLNSWSISLCKLELSAWWYSLVVQTLSARAVAEAYPEVYNSQVP